MTWSRRSPRAARARRGTEAATDVNAWDLLVAVGAPGARPAPIGPVTEGYPRGVSEVLNGLESLSRFRGARRISRSARGSLVRAVAERLVLRVAATAQLRERAGEDRLSAGVREHEGTLEPQRTTGNRLHAQP